MYLVHPETTAAIPNECRHHRATDSSFISREGGILSGATEELKKKKKKGHTKTTLFLPPSLLLSSPPPSLPPSLIRPSVWRLGIT